MLTGVLTFVMWNNIRNCLARYCGSSLSPKRYPKLKKNYFKPCKLWEYGEDDNFPNSIKMTMYFNGTEFAIPRPDDLKRITGLENLHKSRKNVKMSYYLSPEHFNDPDNWRVTTQ